MEQDRKAPDPEIMRLLAAAGAAQRDGRTAAARDYLRAVLDIAPGHPQALNSLGIQALASGEFERAAELFSQAAATDTRAPELRINAAKAYRALGDFEAERMSLSAALQIDRRHFIANLRKAELHERLGEAAQAAAHWQVALALAPPLDRLTTDIQACLNHGQFYLARRTDEFATAIEDGLAEARGNLRSDEARRFDAALDHLLGRRKIYLNSCAGLLFPFLPAEEYFPRDLFPWLKQLEAQTPVIRAELEALLREQEPGFAPYVQLAPGSPKDIWDELDHSPAWSAYHFWEMGKRHDEPCRRCPATAAAVAAVPQAHIPAQAPTAFFSILRPRTRIPPHTGVSNIRTTVHLPLIIPEGCGLRVGGETREWKLGEALAFDDTIEHEAWNDSDQLRAVLILDVWNPHLAEVEQSLLSAFYAAADASGHNPNLSS